MSSVVRLDDHRPVDPLENEEVRKLLAKWYRYSIGGTVGYGPVILTPFLASAENDPLHELRFTMPKVMLVIQPTVKAWADGDICTLDYVHAAVYAQPKMVVREWLTACCEIGAITVQEVGGEVCFVPSRGIVYRVLEIILSLYDCMNDLSESVPVAFEYLNGEKDWLPIETPLPVTY